MYVVASHLMVQKVLGELLCHALGERHDEDALVALGTHQYFLHEVVYLVQRGAHLYDGV